MELKETAVSELINWTDEVGVISIYVGITPEGASAPTPGWAIEVKNQLRDLVSRAEDERPHAEWVAVRERVEALNGALERLLDASRHGRGRALFAKVADDQVETMSLQLPFADRAILDRNPYVRPLVAAMDEGRAAGIVALAKRGIRVLEWRLGVAEEIERGEFTIGGRLWRQKSGPAPSQPQDTRHGGQRRDEFEERVDENRLRFVRERADEVAEFANDRGWDRLIVAGDPRLTKPFADELQPAPGEQLQITDLSWDDEAANVVAEQAWDEFKVMRRQRAEQLIEQAKDRTLSGGAGALGLGEVLASLNEGRVDRLLVAEAVQHEGFISEDGLLYADDQRPEADDLREEPLLVERMIERALATSANVTPIQDDVATGLDGHDGVAAILRW